MPRTTPTALAEQRYASRGGPMPVGPYGLPIPAAKAPFRVSADPAILAKMVTTALGWWSRVTLTDDLRDAAALILITDVVRRYPSADMVVLERYGYAHRTDTFVIDLERTLYRMALPFEVLTTGTGFRFNASSRPNGDIALLPIDARPFFELVAQVQEISADMRSFAFGVTPWPSKFRANFGRPPRWEEIEEAWPVLGKWLAAERAAASSTQTAKEG